MDSCKKITECEVCGSKDLKPVLDLGNQPMCDDLIPIGSSASCQQYPIQIVYCETCKTAHQLYQIPQAILFPSTYHYRSRLTGDVLRGMSLLVESVKDKIGPLDSKVVLDIGCNDGSLLDRFRDEGAKTIGVEPTGASLDATGKNHHVFNSYFNAETSLKIQNFYPKIDIITFTNVFAHIEDLRSLMHALKPLMSESTVLVIENHYLGSILNRHQFDTFYHEHPRTYSLRSFDYIAASLDREVIAVEFPQRYGGNIRVFIGRPQERTSLGSPIVDQARKQEEKFSEEFQELTTFIKNWKEQKTSEIHKLVDKYGKLSAKAFPGRAAILISILQLTDNEIEAVYEKPDSPKIGHYLPGTRIPIKSDNDLFAKIDTLPIILNMAWHIPDEIETYLRGQGFAGRLIHIL